MRAIKIDPSNKTIEEIKLAVDPNRSLGELRSIIGAEELELIPLDKSFNLLADLHGEQKPSFGFCDLDEPVIHGVAVILGGSPRRLRTLHENKASFDMIVDWRNEQGAQNAETQSHRDCTKGSARLPHQG